MDLQYAVTFCPDRPLRDNNVLCSQILLADLSAACPLCPVLL